MDREESEKVHEEVAELSDELGIDENVIWYNYERVRIVKALINRAAFDEEDED